MWWPRQSRPPLRRQAIFPAVAVLLVLNRLPCAFRSMVLRLIGIGAAARFAAGAGARRERILVTIGAAAGSHRLALLQAGKAAASHSGSVGAAIVNRSRRRRRRRREKSQRAKHPGRRGADFQ